MEWTRLNYYYQLRRLMVFFGESLDEQFFTFFKADRQRWLVLYAWISINGIL